MAKGIFNYGGGKRKIGHSKFDQGFNNLSTDIFGGLSAKAVYETLPDDFWSIGQHTLTKVKPMVAPPFTRIHQNWYAFYVRNQQIWEHWNDYITNGTAYGKVYGSNATNQKLDNPWKVPTISASDIMLPCKIASGFAVPIYHFILSWTSLRSYLGLSTSDLSFKNSAGLFQSSSYDDVCRKSRVTDLFALLFSKHPVFKHVPYFEAYAVFLTPTDTNPTLIYLELAINEEGYDDVLQFLHFSSLSPVTVAGDNGHDLQSAVDEIDIRRYVAFRLFSDSSSSDVSIQNSPFVVNRKVVTSRYNSLDLDSFVFTQRHDLDNYFAVSSSSSSSVIHNVVGIDSRFWGKLYYFNNGDTDSSSWVSGVDGFNVNNRTNWKLSLSWLGYAPAVRTYDQLCDILRPIPSYLGVTTADFTSFFDGVVSFSTYKGPFSDAIMDPYPVRSFFNPTELAGVVGPLKVYGCNISSDVNLPISVFSDDFDGNGSDMYSNFKSAPQSRLTDSLGYYSISWLIHNCKLVLRHLDNMGLPVDALCVRNTFDYRYEQYNALPFFAYSHIWEDHFRNLAVSTPELDFTKTNGYMLMDSGRFDDLAATIRRPSQLPEYFDNMVFADQPSNSWVIPFSYKPKNGKSSEYQSITSDYGDFRHFIDGRNHYLIIDNYQDVFSILTGQCLDQLALSQMFKSYQVHYKNGSVDYNTFSSLFQSDFYLPSYYNGLLRLKFQNFNKDYFTSAMLDPMSGANQVELGETINELRTNETKQSWFERIAQARSVGDFFRAIFGVTPIECPTQAKLCGTDHVDINIGEVIQTSQTTADSPQGSRSGLGQAVGQGGLMHEHCNEHGFIIVLCSHTVEAQYFQGIDRKYIPKASYMDYPTVDFANIGNESILQKEINYNNAPLVPFKAYVPLSPDVNIESQDVDLSGYDRSVYDRNGFGRNKYDASGNPLFVKHISGQYTLTRNIAQTAGTSLDNVFGFLPRWTYYKMTLDQVHGEMRDKLKYWHTFRKFFAQPVLCHEFLNWERVSDSDELNRIFAVVSDDIDDKFLLDTFINASVDRALPYVCVPHSK